nr:hypothetical protein [Tanacetum cinerariifolium]
MLFCMKGLKKRFICVNLQGLKALTILIKSTRGKIDQSLFIKRQKEDILLVQVCVDDIIFGSTKKELCTKFEKSNRIFISQNKYVDEILRKFKYADVRTAITLMDKEMALLKDLDGDDVDVDVHLYRSMIRRSTTNLDEFDIGQEEDKFWRTASARTLDIEEIKINAIIDGHDKTITEASVRRHLKLAYADGISTLPTTEVFKQLALIGPSSLRTSSEGGLGCYITMRDSPVQARPERLSNLPNEPSLEEGNTSRNGEGSMQLLELMDICTKLSDKVTTLENKLTRTKAFYNKALITLTKRVKKLEKKLKHKRRRAVIESSEDEEASLNHKDENINLVQSSKQGEAHETAGRKMDFSTASPQTDVDETLAETLLNIKRSASKDKGKAIMQDSESLKEIKKKEMMQISLDEEIDQRFYEEEQAHILMEEEYAQ